MKFLNKDFHTWGDKDQTPIPLMNEKEIIQWRLIVEWIRDFNKAKRMERENKRLWKLMS